MKIEKSHIFLMSLFSALFIILAGILFVDSAKADNAQTKSQEIIIIENNQAQVEIQKALFLSAKIKTDFSFNGLGLKWQINNDLKNNCFFDIKTNKTDWTRVQIMENSSAMKSEYYFSDPLFLSGNEINLEIKCDDNNYNINELPISYLQLIYFDSQPSFALTTLRKINNVSSKIMSDNKLNIITREEWGADESFRFWNPEYSETKAFVIHHTAGGTGGDDPAATIRGIYYWHAVVLGWGDIGYNYLIDPAGNIYEGRYGGDKVIGAHAYNSSDDINFNEGTIGVSVLGCYEESEDCNTVNEFTNESKEALENLIAVKAEKLKINLTGERNIFSKKLKSIVGHRDVDYTLCPGNLIEDSLPEIMNQAQIKYNVLLGATELKAKIISRTIEKQYFINSTNDVQIVYQNNGTKTWLKDSTYLDIVNDTTQVEQKIFLEEDIVPGEQAIINFTIKARNMLGTDNYIFKLYNDETFVVKSKINISIATIKTDQAQFISHNIPAAILANWQPEIQVIYKNVGLETWQPGTTILKMNRKRVAVLEGNSVEPGKEAVFSFILPDNLVLGTNELKFSLFNLKKRVAHARYTRILRVD